MRLAKEQSANIASAIVVGLCAFVYFKKNILTPTAGMPSDSDLGVYYRAARDILGGRSPYENPGYFYPPLVALLMAPFALTSYLKARWIWFFLSHILLLFAAWLLWRALGRGRLALCCIACVWAFGGAAKETLDVGQLSPVLVLALVIAYTQRGRLRSGFVGLGFALKYIPGLLVVPLILQRRWRALAEFAGVVVLGVILPWLAIWRFFTGARAPISAHYWMGTPAMFSWSIPSVVLRILEPVKRGPTLPSNWEFGNAPPTLHLNLSLECISAAVSIAVLLLGIIALAWVCRGRLSEKQVPWAMAGLVSLSLAAAPVCWTHYQVLQYPGVAMMLVSALRTRAWSAAVAVAGCFALVYCVPENYLNVYHDAHGGWTAASPATLYLWTSVAPFACLGLFGLALARVKNSGGERATLVLDQRIGQYFDRAVGSHSYVGR